MLRQTFFGCSKKWITASIYGFSIYSDETEQNLEHRYSLDGARIKVSEPKGKFKFDIQFIPKGQVVSLIAESAKVRADWINFLHRLIVQ